MGPAPCAAATPGRWLEKKEWVRHSVWGENVLTRALGVSGSRLGLRLMGILSRWTLQATSSYTFKDARTTARLVQVSLALTGRSYTVCKYSGARWQPELQSLMFSHQERELPVCQRTHPALLHCPQLALSCSVPSIQGIRGIIKTALHASQPSSGPLCYAWHSSNLAKPPKPLFW